MKKIITFIWVVTLCLSISAQMESADSTVITFEGFDLPVDTFLNGSDLSGGFTSGAVFLPNTYTITPDFESWSGWSISTETDTVTPGFLNQYSVAAGEGVDGSRTYAVSFVSGGSVIKFADSASRFVQGMFVTNSTYAYLSMREGDAFAKRFGGESGDDPDFFLLTVKKYLDGVLSADSVDFYLADYRFDDNSEDYILNSWEYLDLSSLGVADSLHFSLTSSDVGQFGMNTPAYVCIDNISLSEVITSSQSLDELISIKLYPNPVTRRLHVESTSQQALRANIVGMSGQGVNYVKLEQGTNHLDVSSYAKGTYALVISNGSRQQIVWKFVKQ